MSRTELPQMDNERKKNLRNLLVARIAESKPILNVVILHFALNIVGIKCQ